MDLKTLLEHREFVALIARRLIRDEAEVEDVVQETWVAALEKRPDRAGLRSWLARVARNRSIDLLRRRGARKRRERAAARPDRAPSPAELAERVAWQQHVVEAVLRLEEPYRAVVLLRYYEDLPPREVARRLEIPVNTVRTRLRRALERMRGELERKAGGRRALLLALAPLALPGRPAAAAVATGISMKATVGVLAALVFAVGLVGAVALRQDREYTNESARAGRSGAGGAAAEAWRSSLPEDPNAGVVSAVLIGDLPAECADMGGVRMTVLSESRLVHSEVVPAGPMRLVYPREGRGLFLEMSGPRVVKRTFPLPDRATDLGNIRISHAISYGGRVLDMQRKPIEGAIVYWGAGRFASDPTGKDGRYRIELADLETMTVDSNGFFQGRESESLYVRKDKRWAGPFSAHRSGLGLGYDMHVRFDPGPVLLFPRAQGARIALYPYETHLISASLPAPVDRGVVGEDATFAPVWPAWLGEVFAALDLPGGDRIQMTLDRQDVCATVPFDVDLDEMVTVRIRVLDGTEPAAGARVRIRGKWSMDGEFTPVAGITSVLLYGEVPESGEIGWRFPGERARSGAFQAVTWSCHYRGRLTSGLLLSGETSGSEEYRVNSGGVLPPLRLAEDDRALRNTITLVGTKNQAPHCYGATFLKGGNEVPGQPLQILVRLSDGRQGVKLRLDEGRFDPGAIADLTKTPPQFDQVVMQVALGNAYTSLALTWEDWVKAVGAQTPFEIGRSGPVARGRVRVLDADGEPAPNVIVSTEDSPDPSYFPARVRAMTDARGWTVLGISDHRARWLAVLDPETGQGTALEYWNPARERTVRMRRPVRLRFKLALPGDRPSRPRPVTLLPFAGSYIVVPPGPDSWYETPPIVPELYELLAFAYGTGGKEATLRMPVRDIRSGQTLVLKETRRD